MNVVSNAFVNSVEVSDQNAKKAELLDERVWLMQGDCLDFRWI